MSNFIKPFSIATLAQWKGKISIHKKLVRSKKVVIHQKSELRQDLRARLFFLCCSQSQVLVTPVRENDRRKVVSVGSCMCNEQVKRGFSLSSLVPPPSFPRFSLFHILKCFTRLISSCQSHTDWLSTASGFWTNSWKISK